MSLTANTETITMTADVLQSLMTQAAEEALKKYSAGCLTAYVGDTEQITGTAITPLCGDG